MKKITLLLVIFLSILTIGLGYTISQLQANEDHAPMMNSLNMKTSSLPASLDNLYPPKAKEPILLMSMYEMATSASGILVDLMENDIENVKSNYEKFKTNYQKVSKLVPEWENKFPITPVDELGAALGTGDQGKVMAAFEKVGKICHDCHIENMVAVGQKYHWRDFKAIKVKDPLTNEELNYIQMKQYLDVSFVGIGNDLEQGQKEAAIKNFQDFKVRFEAFKETCMECHDTERRYYVDADVEALINRLGESLNAATIDPDKIQRLMVAIGEESCRKCHLVHLPAAYSKY